ncbi:MAG: hypothetical protein GY853_02215 [PVC group bacterium]|nr:hypothetical protein [PVC group bacterium]
MIEEDDQQRITPVNDLDFNFMITEPVWGKQVTSELDNKLISLMKKETFVNEKGETVIPAEKLWGLLSYYTRDMRLGNLNKEEIVYCAYWLDYAGDCLNQNYVKAFKTALQKVITRLELSQSRNGFFRKRSNTITNESYSQQLEPQKRSMLGKKQNQIPEGGYQR